ncbi:TldD/PmbA family protein [Sphingobium sp. SCG-1]|uniref:TldD/PmbA family protein n=1 Tax=Sphingobium sp. SCG-1 TaxID=2072936 RepID=UPI0016704CA8|nr:metallopeptidase TldD-related protein [Sphingobium sp. SCG-1]
MVVSEAAAAARPPRETGAPTRYLLHDEATLAQVAQDAITFAARICAGRASAFAQENGGIAMKASAGEITSAERNGSHSLTVTIVDNGRVGRANTGVFSSEAIKTTVERAVFIASQVEPDPDSEFADPSLLAYDVADVPLYAPSGMDAAALADAACGIEAATRDAIASQKDSVRILEANVSSSDRRWALAIGSDFCRTSSASMQSRGTQVIAERAGRMASGSWSSSDRRVEDLLPPCTIGATAVDRAIRKLGGRSIETRDCPLLLDATVASSLVAELVQALFGMAQYQKSTFLTDTLGQQKLAAHLDLMEDPTEAYGMASGVCDGEGIAASRRAIVRGGVIEGYFLSTRSARKLEMPLTGNADGPWNLVLKSSGTEAGDDLRAMLRRLDRGLWVTETLGGTVNPVTGAYSKAVAGFWVENGAVVYPVDDITVAGMLPAMLAGIVHVGADVHRSGGTRTGSILIDTMRIAGR